MNFFDFVIEKGIQLELVGPTLNILAQNTSVSYEKISTILMSRSGGYLMINVVGAFGQNLVKKYPELILSLAFFLASLSNRRESFDNEDLFRLISTV